MSMNEGVTGKSEVEMQGKTYDVDMLFIGVRLTDNNVLMLPQSLQFFESALHPNTIHLELPLPVKEKTSVHT